MRRRQRGIIFAVLPVWFFAVTVFGSIAMTMHEMKKRPVEGMRDSACSCYDNRGNLVQGSIVRREDGNGR